MSGFPSTASNFFVQSVKTIKYILIFAGPLFTAAGIRFGATESGFEANSIELDVSIVCVDAKDGENGRVSRPVL
ncbi:hypothetical protein [Leisingera methylohalidivorans]|uniref:hypothetical protein n=1 Tax=Leisingera methylohalidivorans TaxID=133924 RepID=UPI0012EC2280|nr:hypothetical protein [Leisingera methylohalidivorans]